jgi:dTDP-4-amino-4,6-dideoxygalactose transaminase
MARSVLSLPVFPQLSDAEVEHIASCLREFVRGQRLKRSIET